jgi:hypothetical protein
MRKLMAIGALLASLSGLGLAETWTGTLLDANCSQRHHTMKSCDARRSTTAFVLDVNGTKYRLDAKSDEAARSAIKGRSDKATNPFATKAVPVTAKVTGRIRSKGKIRADIIEVQ